MTFIVSNILAVVEEVAFPTNNVGKCSKMCTISGFNVIIAF